MRSIFYVVSVLCLTLPGFAARAESTQLTVADAWVREVPPVSRMTAAYLVVRNPTSRERAVLGVSSPDYERAEVHRTATEDGVARMREQERVSIPPGGQVAFEPGGLHVMLIAPRRAVAKGDRVELVLQLDEGESLQVTAPVTAGAEGGMENHHHHHHHHD